MIMEKKWIVTHLNIFCLNQTRNLVVAVAAVVAVPTVHQTKKSLLNGMNIMKHLGISNAVGLQNLVIRFFIYLVNYV